MQCKVQTQWKIYFHFKLNIIIFKSQIQASGSEYTSAKFSVYFLSNPISAAGCFRVSCFRTNWIFNNSSSKSKARASHLWWLSLKCLHNKLTCVCIVCTVHGDCWSVLGHDCIQIRSMWLCGPVRCMMYLNIIQISQNIFNNNYQTELIWIMHTWIAIRESCIHYITFV